MVFVNKIYKSLEKPIRSHQIWVSSDRVGNLEFSYSYDVLYPAQQDGGSGAGFIFIGYCFVGLAIGNLMAGVFGTRGSIWGRRIFYITRPLSLILLFFIFLAFLIIFFWVKKTLIG